MSVLVAGILSGCEPYRIEHHKRSPIYFNEKVVEGGVNDQVTLEDGTVVMYEPIQATTTFGRTGDNARQPLKIREETADGEVILRALVPEHVLMNLLACLRAEEYELIYDQLLSDDALTAYEQNGGLPALRDYMSRHRVELARLLTRMIAGIPQQQLRVIRLSDDVSSCRLVRPLNDQFTFKRVDVIRQKGNFKLLNVG